MTTTTKTCPHCKSDNVHIDATRCPQCRGKLKVWTRQRALVQTLLVLLAVGFFISWSEVPEPSTADNKLAAARTYAREIVAAVPLKAPATAEYARPSVQPDPKDPTRFKVSSYIDSQNGFGAMIRTYWTMRLRYSGTDDNQEIDRPSNWTIEEFIFDGDKIK